MSRGEVPINIFSTYQHQELGQQPQQRLGASNTRTMETEGPGHTNRNMVKETSPTPKGSVPAAGSLNVIVQYRRNSERTLQLQFLQQAKTPVINELANDEGEKPTKGSSNFTSFKEARFERQLSKHRTNNEHYVVTTTKIDLTKVESNAQDSGRSSQRAFLDFKAVRDKAKFQKQAALSQNLLASVGSDPNSQNLTPRGIAMFNSGAPQIELVNDYTHDNHRGIMNFGSSIMPQGQYSQSLVITPTMQSNTQVNTGVHSVLSHTKTNEIQSVQNGPNQHSSQKRHSLLFNKVNSAKLSNELGLLSSTGIKTVNLVATTKTGTKYSSNSQEEQTAPMPSRNQPNYQSQTTGTKHSHHASPSSGFHRPLNLTQAKGDQAFRGLVSQSHDYIFNALGNLRELAAKAESIQRLIALDSNQPYQYKFALVSSAPLNKRQGTGQVCKPHRTPQKVYQQSNMLANQISDDEFDSQIESQSLNFATHHQQHLSSNPNGGGSSLKSKISPRTVQPRQSTKHISQHGSSGNVIRPYVSPNITPTATINLLDMIQHQQQPSRTQTGIQEASSFGGRGPKNVIKSQPSRIHSNSEYDAKPSSDFQSGINADIPSQQPPSSLVGNMTQSFVSSLIAFKSRLV